MPRFRRKPTSVDAVQYTGTNNQSIGLFAGTYVHQIGEDLYINTPSGPLQLRPTDWCVRKDANDFYPCTAENFAELYEPEE